MSRLKNLETSLKDFDPDWHITGKAIVYDFKNNKENDNTPQWHLELSESNLRSERPRAWTVWVWSDENIEWRIACPKCVESLNTLKTMIYWLIFDSEIKPNEIPRKSIKKWVMDELWPDAEEYFTLLMTDFSVTRGSK